MILPHFSLSFSPVPISESLALLYMEKLAFIYRAFVLLSYFLSIAFKNLCHKVLFKQCYGYHS